MAGPDSLDVVRRSNSFLHSPDRSFLSMRSCPGRRRDRLDGNGFTHLPHLIAGQFCTIEIMPQFEKKACLLSVVNLGTGLTIFAID